MLKYNSRDQLKSKLNILKCCIAEKGLQLANSIALGLGNVSCLTKELKILNKYYKILECYYPYDCIYLTDTPQELMQITKQMLPNDIPNIGTGVLSTHFGVNNLSIIVESVVGSPTGTIPITNNNLVGVAEQANYALIQVESSVTSGVVIRFWLDGSEPTTTDGIGRSHLTAIDIAENSNLKNFRVIATGAGTHKLMIQYYSK